MANYVSFAVINSPSLVCQNMLTAMMQYLIGQYEGGGCYCYFNLLNSSFTHHRLLLLL